MDVEASGDRQEVLYRQEFFNRLAHGTVLSAIQVFCHSDDGKEIPSIAAQGQEDPLCHKSIILEASLIDIFLS